MSCCSGKRSAMAAARAPLPNTLRPREAHPAVFEYTGKTALYVVGPATNRHYRFFGPGARVAVDLQDASFLVGVPQLKLCKSV